MAKTERQTKLGISQKELSSLYKSALDKGGNFKLYNASEEEMKRAHSKVFDILSKRVDSDAQMLIDKGESMIAQVDGKIAKAPIFTFSDLENEGKKVKARSENAYIANFTRRHKGDIDLSTLRFSGDVVDKVEDKHIREV